MPSPRSLSPMPPPPQDVFTSTDGLRALIRPHNVDTPRALPTNAWWGNLLAWNAVAEPGAAQQRDSDPIFANPYAYHIAGNGGLAVSYLHQYRVEGPRNENGAIKYYFYPATIKNIVLSASEWVADAGDRLIRLRIQSWDDLGATLQLWQGAALPGGHALKPPTHQYATTYVAMGNAFTTMHYHGLHAQLQTDHAVVRVNGTAFQPGQVLAAAPSIEFELNNGQKWIAFFFATDGASSAASGSSSTSTAASVRVTLQSTTLTTESAFTGVVQLAYVPSDAEMEDPEQASGQVAQARGGGSTTSEQAVLALYRATAGVYPAGASLCLDTADNKRGHAHHTAERADGFGFDWRLQHVGQHQQQQQGCEDGSFSDNGGNGSGAEYTLLHFALPHLQDMMDPTFATAQPVLSLWSHTRGRMLAYTTNASPRGNKPSKRSQWRFQVPQEISKAVDAQATSFLPVHGEALTPQDVHELELVRILTQEIMDADWNAALPHEGSYYFKGKALQKFGTMCLVAQRLAQTTTPELATVAKQGIAKLRALLLQELVGNKKWAFPLVYDTVYKGIVSSEALVRRDLNADFGNAAYNDHHYHFGYLIMACAMLLHLEAQQSPQEQKQEEEATAEDTALRRYCDTLLRDVCNPHDDTLDPFFPRFRQFNWFLGHSYSHGVTPMADGKDEESTSEETNFLYAMALYGSVTENTSLTALARLMLKVNTLAIRTYFIMTDADYDGQQVRRPSIHPKSFAKNKVTGICFDNKCDYATWFSPAQECIHGIQMLPVSPMLDIVRPVAFIREEWEQILARLGCVAHWDTQGSGWTSLLYSNAAALDPVKACDVLKRCPMDDGLSRAWAVYMAAIKKKMKQTHS